MTQTRQKSTNNFNPVTAALKKMLQPYKAKMVLTSDVSVYSLSTRHLLPNKQTLFFASFQPRKNYVSYYLMPVYIFPDLLTGISPELRRRMQGKSCFNFKDVDPALFKELAALTKAGFERYKKEGLLK